jgi:hypothetical protein
MMPSRSSSAKSEIPFTIAHSGLSVRGVNTEGHADLDDRGRLRGALEQDGLVRRAFVADRTHLRPCCKDAIGSHRPEVEVLAERVPLLALERYSEIRTNALQRLELSFDRHQDQHVTGRRDDGHVLGILAVGASNLTPPRPDALGRHPTTPR